MAVTVHHYPGCSTCKRAVKWLREAGVDFALRDLTVQTPSAKELRDLHARSGQPVRKLFNTSGKSYREGGFKEQLDAGMTDAQAFAALAADGMLIKRPLLDTGDTVCIGFREDAWAEALAL